MKFCYSKIYPLNGEKEINDVHNIIQKLYSEYKKKFLPLLFYLFMILVHQVDILLMSLIGLKKENKGLHNL